jgi:hypothetical protein
MDFSLKGVSKLSLVGMSIACRLSFSGCPRHPATWTPRPPYRSTIGTNDFDLSPASTDPNGAPDKPRWAPQIQQSPNLPPTTGSECIKKNGQPYQSTCTDQSKYLVEDRGTGITGALCSLFGDSSSINGHANWNVVADKGPWAG